MSNNSSSSFLEVSIGPKNEKKQKTTYTILFYLNIALIVLSIGCFINAFYVSNLFWFPFALLLFFDIVVSVFKRKCYNFYDYAFILGSVRTHVVINNKKSKPFAYFDCNKILQAGNVNSDFYVRNSYNKQYKVYVATPNELTEYDPIFLVQGEKEVKIIALQFNEKFLSKILSCSSLQKFDRDYLKLISNK
ncbi:MAG: hypothetical protein IKV61_04890 [Clostridia bacterium]|nr:hypothetical protein [Clostridia bacterium]